MIQNVLFHCQYLFLWGFIATCAMSIIQEGSQWLGMSRISFPFLVGTAFTMSRRAAEGIGLFCYIIIGWAFATGYGCIFETLGLANWWLGMFIGLFQGLFHLMVIMPLLPTIHPHMASPYDGPDVSRRIEPPGFMALHYGERAPFIHLAGQMVYGLILGITYPLGA